jgi:hypothetical protein
MEKITCVQYFNELIQQFPSLKNEIEEYEELNHIKMEVFARYTNLQIQKRHPKEFKRCLEFQESMIGVMPDEIENALYVSYIESLLLGQFATQMKKKIATMPPKFKEKYEFYEKNYYSLGEK